MFIKWKDLITYANFPHIGIYIFLIIYKLNVILILSGMFYNDMGVLLIKVIAKNKLLKTTKLILKLMNEDDLFHKISSGT